MSFRIKFLDEPVPKEFSSIGEHQRFGEISISNHNERIIINVGYWSHDDYLKQWVHAVEYILNSPDNHTSSLIVGMCDPYQPKYECPVEVWSMFRRGEKVIFQNSHVSINKLTKPFESDLVYFYDSIKYSKASDTAEWETTTADLNQWLNELKLKLENNN
jgi:hypothetical protein